MKIRNSLVVVAVLALSVGVGTAGAVSGPGANDNSKLVYTEAIDRASSNLTVSVSEGGQKRLTNLTTGHTYRLADVSLSTPS